MSSNKLKNKLKIVIVGLAFALTPIFSFVTPLAHASSLQGDLDNNNKVDIFDYNILTSNFGSTQCGNIADIDGNCKVDIFDYNILVSNFGKTSGTPTPSTKPPTATPTNKPTPTSIPSLTPPPLGASRGYLTTPGELRTILQKANQGIEPYKSALAALYSFVGAADYWPYSGFASSFGRDTVDAASTLLYGKAMVYHLKNDPAYAASVRTRLMELPANNPSGSGDPLSIARHIPGFVAAADLLEGYSGWSSADKRAFQDWLRSDRIYKILDEISHVRANNWGFMGSGAAAYVADYLNGSGLTLTNWKGNQETPGVAYRESNSKGFARMNHGDGVMDTSGTCPGMHGIYPSGRIPHETGRGSTGCDGEYLVSADSSLGYMISAANGLVRHAELLLRRGDSSMYDNILSDGYGSLRQAIRYVIDNPLGSQNWDNAQIEILEPAYRYYRHSAIGRELGVGTSNRVIASNQSGGGPNGFLDFTTLTHGFATNENPGRPPTVSPPTP